MIAIYRALDEIPADFGPSVAAIGNFDGVHLGHRQLLGALLAEARERRAKAIAITFDPHPDCFLRPESFSGLLTPIPDRIRLLEATGIDAVLVLPFDAQLAGLTARQFVADILTQRLGVIGLHEGENFRFGCRAHAGIDELADFGREFGFGLTTHAAVATHGLEVSSSAIRAALSAGDIRRARWMLGRPFAVQSRPARGRGIGSKLLVPTINLAAYNGLLPAFGVYASCLTIAGRAFPAVTNVGNRPTFGEPSFAVESYILDFEPVALEEGTALQLEFLLRLRGERTWPSPEALKAQIVKDVARAKRFFRLAHSAWSPA